MDVMDWTGDRIETEMIRLEGLVGRIRGVQALLVDEADRRQMPRGDGARSLIDWVCARLDVTRTTATDLVTLARSGDVDDLETGQLSADRAVARRRLVDAGASKQALDHSDLLDLAGIKRLTAHHSRRTPHQERDTFTERALTFQPNRDGSATRFWGTLTGVDGQTVIDAITRLGDELTQGTDDRGNRAQRNADALVAICHDNTPTANTEPAAVVIVDARLAATTNGETGVTVLTGPRVGPQALQEILCGGTTEIVALTADGTPLGIGNRTTNIPPRLRRYILARDGACTADGCHSTYRLQPHHIIERAQHGPTQPENLVTLCWWHHHIVIHGRGFRIDPNSPPTRLRFLPPAEPRSRAG